MKIGIIGAGGVGSSTAFALIMRGVARKIVLIDQDFNKAKAQAHDIEHAAPFAYANKIKAGQYKDLDGANIVIVTAGANQEQNETRLDLLDTNVKIFKSIIPQIAKYAPNAILIVTSNPVDIMTSVAIKLSGFSPDRVFGSGTVLDTSRFKTLLGYHLGISPQSIHANVFGEHGDSEVLAWSNAVAGNTKIELVAKELQKPLNDELKASITNDVKNAAYNIIEGKGSTTFGIAGALCKICQAIINNEYAVLNVSSHYEQIATANNICISLPCIIGKRGIHNKLQPRLDDKEEQNLIKSAKIIEDFTQKAFESL